MLTGLQISNPVLKKSFSALYTGNLGGAVLPSVFAIENEFRKFRYGMRQFDAYDFGISPGILRNKKIFTSLAYQRGTRKEQYFLLTHRQKFGKKLVGGLDFGAGASQGFYARQLTAIRNFDIFGLYETKENRYRLYARFIYNKAGTQENGGIKTDTNLIGVSAADARTLPVWLTDAERVHREKAVYFQQQAFIFRQKPDTAIFTNTPEYNIDLTHSFHFSDKSMVFQAASIHDDYFANTYYDSTLTFDSSHTRSYLNDLRVNLSAKNFGSLDHWLDADLFAGATHESFKINQRQLDTLFQDLSVYGGIRFRVMDVVTLRLRYSQPFETDIAGGERFEALFRYRSFNDFLVADIRYENEKRVPDLFSQLNFSNHFIWVNRYPTEKRNRFDIMLGLPWWKFNAGLSYLSISNMVYYDHSGYPVSHSGTVDAWAANFSHEFSYRRINLINRLVVQTTNSAGILRLPRFTSFHGIFYEKAFFRKVLLTQIGVDFRYHDDFYSPYYHPATGQFILQDEKSYGDYIFADAFLNFQVKTARFFFKVEHVNAGWNNKSNILIARYPMQGRMFKFGIAWNIFD